MSARCALSVLHFNAARNGALILVLWEASRQCGEEFQRGEEY